MHRYLIVKPLIVLLKWIAAVFQCIFGFIIYLRSNPPVIEYINEGYKSSEKVSVFSGFNVEVSTSTRRLLESFRYEGRAVVYVSNVTLSNDAISVLRSLVSVIIVRGNYGRDFAGYKVGYSLLVKNNPHISSAIFCNDTFIYPLCNPETFWEGFRKTDFSLYGAYLSLTPSVHIQSFLFQVRGDLFYSRPYKEFWNNYVPFNARYFTILFGELAHSRCVRDAGYTIDGYVSILSFIKAYRSKNKRKGLSDQKLAALFMRANPAHTASIMSVELMSVPLIKKDILAGGVVSVVEIADYLNNRFDNHNDANDVFRELLKKPFSWQLPLIARIKKKLEMI